METQSMQTFDVGGPANPILGEQPQARPGAARNIFIGIILGGIISLLCFACLGTGLVVNSMGLAQDCKSRGPSWLDELWVQNYSRGFFENSLWKKSFTSGPDRVTTTWLSDNPSAVAYLDYTVFDCGFGSSYLDDNYNDNKFKTFLFNSYQDVEKINECSQNDLHLFEYKGKYRGTDYRMDFWTQPEGKTRWLNLSLSFPASDINSLKGYAQKIHPEFSSCE